MDFTSNQKKIFLSLSILVVLVIAVVLIFVFDSDESEKQAETHNSNSDQMVKTANAYKSKKSFKSITKQDTVWGEQDAPVEIVVYENYEDSFSTQMNNHIQTLKEIYPEQIQIAFRPFFATSQSSALYSAQALECAKDQDQFFTLRRKLFNSNGDLWKLAEESPDIDGNQLQECLTDNKYKDKVLEKVKQAGNYGVTGTPTVFIEDQMIIGVRDVETQEQDGEKILGLKDLVAQHLNK